MRQRRAYNPKRRISLAQEMDADARLRLAARVRYGGNAEHKMRPNDYGLTPATNPRRGKSLCDEDRPFLKEEAAALLTAGAARGLVSRQQRNGWPQNIWAVDQQGRPFEAELENPDTGAYHGYPMPEDDDFRNEVLSAWKERT